MFQMLTNRYVKEVQMLVHWSIGKKALSFHCELPLRSHDRAIDNMHKCWPLITTTKAAAAATYTTATTCFWLATVCITTHIATGRSWQKYYKRRQHQQQQQRQRRQLQFVQLHETSPGGEAGRAQMESWNRRQRHTHAASSSFDWGWVTSA